MLKVQEYLHKNGIEKLKSKYKVKITSNDYDDRMLLNYDQLDSEHKTSPITRNCRGLCLNKNDFSLISRGFERFFNLGEYREDDNKFDWNNCFATSKEDGSYIQLYWYNNKWQVQTRASFGIGPIDDTDVTFDELFWKAATSKFNEPDVLNKKYTYIFELCSTYNKIVRHYPNPTLYLLSIFEGENELEWEEVMQHARILQVLTPTRYEFHSINEVKEHIEWMSKLDKTYEGVVLRDKDNNRLKVKNPDYLLLHRIRGETGQLHSPKNLLPFILKGELDELFCYYPEVIETVEKMEKVLKGELSYLTNVWNAVKGSATRKEFALKIPHDLRTKSLLFTALDRGCEPFNLWRESGDLLLKVLF